MKPQKESLPPGAGHGRFQPGQWSVLGFRFVPLLLFAIGTCGVIYGGLYHRIPVTETHEEEVSVAVPAEPSAPPGVGPGLPGAAPFPPAWDAGPPVKFITQIKTITATTEESESAVNRAVSVGGVTRTDSGGLARVGGGGGKGGPSFCPT